MEIKEHIELKISEYLVSRLNKLIDDEDYYLSKLSSKRFGHYDISIHKDYIKVASRSTKFYFNFKEEIIEDKTFFGFKKIFFFKLGENEIIKNTIIGKLKDKLNLYKEQQNNLEAHKDMINSLPDDVKKDVIRLQKFKTIIDDDDDNS